MKNIFINGKFLCQKITGVQRYAIEMVKQFDILNPNDIKFTIITPSNKYIVSNLNLKNIKIINLKGKPNYYWEQIKLARYCKKNKPDDLLNFCNVAPIFYPGSCVIHDIAWIDAPSGYSKKFIKIYDFIIRKNIKKCKFIFTVSNVMKNRIEEFYGVNNINVIYCSAEHILAAEPTKPQINLPKSFYFSLGSINPNKNFKAIINIAKNNPNDFYVISGNKHKSFEHDNLEKVKNVLFTGYLNDNELVYLYQNCKAFLFPSVYEGFGIPPLEAMLCGCKNVICNDIPVLRELYDGFAKFIDFSLVNNISDSLLSNKDVDIKNLKNKFSWQNSAQSFLSIIK